jgi:hypothetical protein
MAMLWRNLVTNYRLAVEAALIVAVVVGLRALLFALGCRGFRPPLWSRALSQPRCS